MGNFIQQISDRVTVIASARLWLEDAAVQQLTTTAGLPGMLKVAGLPDLHPGRGYPVGAAFFSVGRFYPALVGNDIGCGMALWQTDLPAGRGKLDKLDKQIGNLDQPVNDDEWAVLVGSDQSLLERREALSEALAVAGLGQEHLRSLGTIGRGNHFAELQMIDQLECADSVSGAGVEHKCLQLLVHSGSRGLGQAVLSSHVAAFGHSGLAPEGIAAQAYLQQHAAAVQFAELNRALIGARILHRLRCRARLVLDVNHNTVTPARIDDQLGWLHRKGATPSDCGLVMLPGSRDDYSYMLEPLTDHCAVSLQSLAHGAGRKWQRSECKDRLIARATPSQLSRTSLGGRVICNDRALIYEEAAQAYKRVDSVLACLVGAGLVRVLYRSKPVLTYKTRGECC
ncbi:RNA ligase RtcB family protein [Duganella sp. FT80W]|uniref:3'-phosphate/5'-hydroxy nucleic acid ligase n=1 Tax=Duganella guangzhouensis TaxID=2666084 RepID=A0A6I2L1H1_9BURK|nr:RNA ligase RtcB family protein [Duganella guangzhouensis]MRW91713.1 RNA ligase RtcB family protein [Duganella guangzhouensis]